MNITDKNILNILNELEKRDDKSVESGVKPDIYRILLNEFNKELDQDSISTEKDTENRTELKDKLNNANIIISRLIDRLNDGDSLLKEKETSEKTCDISINIKLNTDGIKRKLTLEDEPTVLRPLSKTEGIFNDVNLTEDYELGMRFYQLGLKTGFFNVKLDSGKNSTRIATAEFFPNKFWPAVKQRSRWIAGICMQNWKAHKWNGNLRTK